jgi:hypothetical protein
MAEKITTVLVTLIGLFVLAGIIGAVAMVGLAATGDVGEANGCRSYVADAAGNHEFRGVNADPSLADAWQAKWDDFDAKLDAAQSASVSFSESETTSRATRYLEAKDTPISNLVICFHEGDAEAFGKVGLPILGDLPGVGGAFESNVRVRGTMDFTGANPKIVISEIEAGNLPDSAAEKLKGQIESLINDRLEDLSLTHDFAPVFTEGSVQINGTP